MQNKIKATLSGRDIIDSGTIVVPPFQTVNMTIGMLNYTFNFQRNGLAPSFTSSQGLGGWSLNFWNFDNPVGQHIDLNGFIVDGIPAVMSLVIYAVGETNPVRILHYTLARAAAPAPAVPPFGLGSLGMLNQPSRS